MAVRRAAANTEAAEDYSTTSPFRRLLWHPGLSAGVYVLNNKMMSVLERRRHVRISAFRRAAPACF